MSRRVSPSDKPKAEPTVRRRASADSGARVHTLTAQLVHDVGKYIARTARNLATDIVMDAELLTMLSRDLYGDDKAGRPAARFAVLAAELRQLWADAPLAPVEHLLVELERSEAAVRAGQPEAVRQAAALALQIENLLRALAAAGPAPARRHAR